MVAPLAFELFTGPDVVWMIVGALALAFILATACDSLVWFALGARKGPYGSHPHSRGSRRVHRDRASCVPTSYAGALVVLVTGSCSLVLGYALGRALLGLLGAF